MIFKLHNDTAGKSLFLNYLKKFKTYGRSVLHVKCVCHFSLQLSLKHFSLQQIFSKLHTNYTQGAQQDM